MADELLEWLIWMFGKVNGLNVSNECKSIFVRSMASVNIPYENTIKYIIFHFSIVLFKYLICLIHLEMRLHQVFREVLNNLDAKCTESQLDALRGALKPDTTDPVDRGKGVNLEMALMWIFSPKQKKMDEEKEAIEALRVRLASGAIIFTLDSSISTVMQLRGRVAEILGRCVDEIKLIALNRQLQDEELCQDLLCEQCLEVTAVTSAIPQLDSELPVLDQLDVLRQMIMSSSLEYQLEAANHLRKLLSVGDHPPIDKILELGVAPRLLELSQQMTTPELQFETLWAIVNIVSGDADQTRSVVELDAVPILLKILQEAPTVKVQEQAVWAIGNIAGDSIQHRDLCHAHGAMSAVLEVLEHCTKITCLRHAMWMVSNLCRGAPKPRLEDLIPALPLLKKHLCGDDAELLADALWSLSYISDGPNQYIQAVIDADLVPPVVTLLSHPDQSVHTPALRSVGNLVTGSDTQTDAVLDCCPLDSVMTMMSSPRVQIRKECCWLLSNICAGSLHQVEQIRAHKFFDQFTILARDAERSVQKEAAFAIANASENKDMIKDLISAGCMTAMHELMDNNDYNIQNLCLCFISNVRKALISEDSTSPYWTQFLETFSIEDVEEMLENAGNEAVRIKAQELIDQMNSDAACRQSVE